MTYVHAFAGAFGSACPTVRVASADPAALAKNDHQRERMRSQRASLPRAPARPALTPHVVSGGRAKMHSIAAGHMRPRIRATGDGGPLSKEERSHMCAKEPWLARERATSQGSVPEEGRFHR
jgi:hypothetical protein